MFRAVSDYFQELTVRFGNGWNRFWYAPSDPYGIGVLRLCTGLLALYFQLSFTPDLVRLFADGGLLPTSLVTQWYGQGSFDFGRFSYLSHLHTPAELYAGHAAGALILVLMTVGLFSRFTTVLGLGVVLSYIHRAPMLTSEVEPILAILMFYLCFAPTGAALSLDRLWATRRASSPLEHAGLHRQYFSATVVTRLIQVHLAAVYLMSGLAKVQGPAALSGEAGANWTDPWGTGLAVWLMIGRPESRWVDLTFLRHWPYLVNAWTHYIVVVELVFPILVWNRLARPLLLAAAALMWGSLALVSGAAPFCAAMLIGNLAFFPPEVLRGMMGGGQREPLARPAIA